MGRNVVLFVVLGSLHEMQERSVVFWVFYLWSISEVFRLVTESTESCVGVQVTGVNIDVFVCVCAYTIGLRFPC